MMPLPLPAFEHEKCMLHTIPLEQHLYIEFDKFTNHDYVLLFMIFFYCFNDIKNLSYTVKHYFVQFNKFGSYM